MNPIQNSIYKENIRLKNEGIARNQEQSINYKLNTDINNLKPKTSYTSGPFWVIGIVLGIIIAIVGGGFGGFIIGVVGGLVLWGIANASVKSFNQNIEDQKTNLRNKASSDIRAAYAEADRKTQNEINAYDSDVKKYSQTILKNAGNFNSMVDHQVMMFERMIFHADHGAHMRFVEADLIYTVNTYGITYSYNSKYTNTQDDYNFNRERYRDLKSTAECEGLAQALAKMTMAKMKKSHPANSMNITVSHMDAQVTLHFKGANKNFVPARDIL